MSYGQPARQNYLPWRQKTTLTTIGREWHGAATRWWGKSSNDSLVAPPRHLYLCLFPLHLENPTYRQSLLPHWCLPCIQSKWWRLAIGAFPLDYSYAYTLSPCSPAFWRGMGGRWGPLYKGVKLPCFQGGVPVSRMVSHAASGHERRSVRLNLPVFSQAGPVDVVNAPLLQCTEKGLPSSC